LRLSDAFDFPFGSRRIPRHLLTAAAVLAAGALLSKPALGAKPAPRPLPPESVYIGAHVGFPASVGGLIGIDVHRRLGPRSFVQIGGGTSLLLHGVYMSYGRVIRGSFFAVGGLDASVFTPIFGAAYGGAVGYTAGGALFLPGAHVGAGFEFFPGGWRIAPTLTAGYPWIFGVKVDFGS